MECCWHIYKKTCQYYYRWLWNGPETATLLIVPRPYWLNKRKLFAFLFDHIIWKTCELPILQTSLPRRGNKLFKGIDLFFYWVMVNWTVCRVDDYRSFRSRGCRVKSRYQFQQNRKVNVVVLCPYLLAPALSLAIPISASSKNWNKLLLVDKRIPKLRN